MSGHRIGIPTICLKEHKSYEILPHEHLRSLMSPQFFLNCLTEQAITYRTTVPRLRPERRSSIGF